MRLIMILILLISNAVFAQKKLDEIFNNPDFNCKKTKNTSFEKLAKSFPLSQTAKIQIVSFKYSFSVDTETGELDKKYNIDSLPRIGNKLDYKSIKEFKNLEMSKIIELSDLLYNFNFNPKKEKTIVATGCYEPRNAIVFLDGQDNIVEFIEICFGCGKYHSFKNIDYGEYCNGKVDLIKNFFFLTGIKYGVTEE